MNELARFVPRVARQTLADDRTESRSLIGHPTPIVAPQLLQAADLLSSEWRDPIRLRITDADHLGGVQ